MCTQIRISASLPVSCDTVVGNDATISSPEAYELSEGTLYPLQTFKKSLDNPGDEQSLYEELKQFPNHCNKHKSHEQLHE